MGKFINNSQTRWQDDLGQVLTSVHPADQCLNDKGCTIHGPSTHHMVYWPQTWRGDLSFMERICSHGIGHPDPDDPKTIGDDKWAERIHGCDGCCFDG